MRFEIWDLGFEIGVTKGNQARESKEGRDDPAGGDADDGTGREEGSESGVGDGESKRD